MRRALACLIAAICVIGIASTSPARAEPSTPVLSRLVESGKLRVGMSGNQPPLNFKNRAGEIVGLEADLAQMLAGLLGLELEIVQKPFGELLGALESGQVDLVASGMTITLERSVRTPFVGPYYLSGKSILTKSSTLAQIADAEQLDQPELKLVALAGSTSERFVHARIPKASLVTAADYDAAVALLLADQVDALVADMEIVTLTAVRNPEAGLATLREPLTIEPIGIAVPPGDDRFAKLLEQELDSLEASGVLSAIRARWLEQSDWLAQLP